MPVTRLPNPKTFDLIFIGGQGIMMDYMYSKFGNFHFSRFGFILQTDRQNHRQTDRITDRQTE